MDAHGERRVGEGSSGSIASLEQSCVEHFGADAVPLRPAAERRTELETEERLRLAAAGLSGKSALRGHRRVLAFAVPVLGFIVLAPVQLIGGSGRSSAGRMEGPATISASPHPGRTKGHRSSLAPAHPVRVRGGDRSGRDRVRRPSPRKHQQGRSGSDPQSRQTSPNHAAGPPPPEFEPEPEPSPEPEPAPLESEAPPPEPMPEPTSSADHQASGRSEVETQFGFEQ
jgi:hypothetical protein